LGGAASEIVVNADGAWTLQVTQPSAAMSPSQGGNGDAVLRIGSGSSPSRILSLSHTGTSNFVAIAWGANGSPSLLVNDIGAYQGTVRVPPGVELLEIVADGEWRLALD
jgi:hypothetical protein